MLKQQPSPVHGTGVFAKKPLRKGQYLGYFSGYEVPNPTFHSVTCHGVNIEPTSLLKYLNHSTRPNAGFKGRKLMALKNIAKDEELFINYSDTEPEITEDFDVIELRHAE